jgi:molybdate transport system substrate-binding protein
VTRVKRACVLLSAIVFAAACSHHKPGTITVFAASSLTEPFTALGKSYEKAHPGAKVKFNFGSSSTLATQILTGGEADVFASADEASMRRLLALVTSPQVFARNRLEIVVGRGNPKKIKKVSDLARRGVQVALCVKTAPCGKLAGQVLAKAKTKLRGASREENVKAVLTKVRLGEADAGLVYVTDVASAGKKVTGVKIPDASNAVAVYPIAILSDSPDPMDATGFVDFVLSASGRKQLVADGFLPR